MGRVCFDHHRATRRERGGGVAAGDGEGEREVGRAEHRNRAERNFALAQIGTPSGWRSGSAVDPRAVPAPLAHAAANRRS